MARRATEGDKNCARPLHLVAAQYAVFSRALRRLPSRDRRERLFSGEWLIFVKPEV